MLVQGLLTHLLIMRWAFSVINARFFMLSSI